MSLEADIPGVQDPGEGRRIGIDVGKARIGVAVSDRAAMLATPVETVYRLTGTNDSDQADIDDLVDIITEYEAVEVVVGLPKTLKNKGSASALDAADIARRITRRISPVPVRLADERLTTVVAQSALHASGVNTKKGRSVIDQAAAVEILQTWLDGRSNYLSRAAQESEGETL
ncbi:Holliday junction resolvase-like protein [Corynebacterium renale]|uniref:Holliday junction resolvase RuvX n=1 Tax=Corynebacterium renale TaxID=1724 RepID=UPI000DA33DD1|nr:Holliday junction resolvase RuvX [Corynebacterium renale]SQG64778.1 Holliday junction resolvase-like protein [Corynebacterium renale]STC96232.1 Holliday junction resolvase-like protein [Corynebacterium renale]